MVSIPLSMNQFLPQGGDNIMSATVPPLHLYYQFQFFQGGYVLVEIGIIYSRLVVQFLLGPGTPPYPLQYIEGLARNLAVNLFRKLYMNTPLGPLVQWKLPDCPL